MIYVIKLMQTSLWFYIDVSFTNYCCLSRLMSNTVIGCFRVFGEYVPPYQVTLWFLLIELNGCVLFLEMYHLIYLPINSRFIRLYWLDIVGSCLYHPFFYILIWLPVNNIDTFNITSIIRKIFMPCLDMELMWRWS